MWDKNPRHCDPGACDIAKGVVQAVPGDEDQALP